MRGWPKTPDAALIASSEHIGLPLNEWQRNCLDAIPSSKHIRSYSKQSYNQGICPVQQGYPAECGASSQFGAGVDLHTLGGYSNQR